MIFLFTELEAQDWINMPFDDVRTVTTLNDQVLIAFEYFIILRATDFVNNDFTVKWIPE